MGQYLSAQKIAELQDVLVLANAFNEMVGAGRDLNRKDFGRILEKAILTKCGKCTDNETKGISLIMNEMFRILAKGKNDVIDKFELRRARDELLDIRHSRAVSAGILDVVLLGKKSAAKSFADRKYQVTILETEEKLYRVGNPNEFLGQYFTRKKPSSLVEMRKTFAIKDDWNSPGVTFHEVFAPQINTIHAVDVPAGIFLYEGEAASLKSFMAVDELAAEIFVGGEHQIMIVAPWDVGGKDWTHKPEALDAGIPWKLLQYEPTELCKRAFYGTLQGPDFKDINETTKNFNLSPLHHACMCSDRNLRSATVETLLRQNADPNLPLIKGLTPLMIAAQVGDVDVVLLLLTNTQNEGIKQLDSREHQLGRSALHFAAQQGSAGVLEMLLSGINSSTFDIDAQDNEGYTPLWIACHHGQWEAVKVLLNKGADANLPSKRFEAPLLTAVCNKHSEVVRVLLESGKLLTPPVREEFDLLHKAVASGSSEVVKHLACLGPKVGLDVNAARTTSAQGDTALHLAVIRNNHDCVRALLSSASVKVGVKCLDGWTPLHLAVQKSEYSMDVIEAILDCEFPPINETTRDLSTALILAAELQSEDSSSITATLLAVPGVDVNARNQCGYTALYVAAGKGNVETVNLLCAHQGTDIEARDNEGWMPLHRAARNGHLLAVDALLQKKADINATNTKNGRQFTCLSVAQSRQVHDYLKRKIGQPP